MSYTAIDAYGSVITVDSSIVSGVVQQPIVQISSVLSTLPVSIRNVPSVNALITNIPSVSGTVGASIIGLTPVTISSVLNIVPVAQTGQWITSLVGQPIYSDNTSHTNLDRGIYVLGLRNDAVASLVSSDLKYISQATDPAGRVLIKPFAAEQARIEGTISLTSTSVTTVIAAAGAGLKNYITDFWIANTGSVTTLVTFKDGAGSILGYTIAPATSGSNSPGIAMPIRTGANATFDILPANPTSTLFATFTGFKAP